MTRGERERGAPARLLVAVALVAPALPIVVALLARRHPPWVPDLDLALTELRVRDVGGPHTPLVGLPGRLGTLDRQGSHPGPLSFYLLAPTYRLLGSTAFALQAATVALHLAGIAVTIGLVARRAGARWALTAGLATTVLVVALGPNLFTEPWNPHLPLLWGLAFLAAAWCALAGDAVALPVLALAGALCAQTHVSYLGAVAVLTVVATAVCLRWSDPAVPRTRPLRWAAAAVGLAVVLWAPPVVDQVRHDPGNLTILGEHLLEPPEATVGWGDGARLVLRRLDVLHLVRSAATDPGRLAEADEAGASALRGAVVLGGLGLATAAVRRRGGRAERAAVGLAVVAVGVAFTSAARVVGHPWGYLTIWMWAVALLAVLACVAAALAWRRAGPARAGPAPVRQRWVAAAMTAVVAVLAVRGAAAGSEGQATNPVVSRTVRALLPEVLAGIGPGQRALVDWDDAVHLGGHGFGLVDELERHGVEVVVADHLRTQFGGHRTVAAGLPDVHLVVVSGAARARWADHPGAVRVASVDERTAPERAEARSLGAALRTALRAAGLDELVAAVDGNVLAVAVSVDPRLTPDLRRMALRLDALGAAAAVFRVPVTG